MPPRRVPFLADFREALLSGAKTATTRTARHAEEGDTFEAFGATFEVLAVRRTTLAAVKLGYWQREGVASPEAFERVWTRIHPRAGFDPAKAVYLHKFRRVA